MIEKQYVTTRKVTKVTFEHPADADGFVPNGHGTENGVVAG